MADFVKTTLVRQPVFLSPSIWYERALEGYGILPCEYQKLDDWAAFMKLIG